MQQENASKIKRIRQISVTNLFGIFNHTIPLKMDDRITIIHGPNGFGKTMMLKMLYALFSPDNRLLQTIPFDEFRVDFEDSTNFWITKTSQSPHSQRKGQIDKREIIFNATGKKPFILSSANPNSSHTYIIESLRRAVELHRRLSDLQSSQMVELERRRIEPHTLRQYIEEFEEFAEQYTEFSQSGGNWQQPLPTISDETTTPKWLVEARKSMPTRFIETQRLLNSIPLSGHDKTRLSEYAVIGDSQHLVEQIRKILAKSASLSQSLDRTFPSRLIRPTTQQLQVSEEELRGKLKKLEEKRSQLMATGLLDQETEATFPVASDQGIDPNTKAVLAVYVEDTEQKLEIFDELAQKIDLLTTIINNRFLYKTMTVDKEKGIVFTSKNGTILPLESLSSGEQHELVLFYELLFRVTPGSLILIDEPELSLHVVWQEHFLKDVQQITKLANINIILATHSPDIISNRRDLVVELEEPENGKL